MRCILHIGTEKTGSTTLQKTLQENRGLLESQGILFSRSAGEQLSRELAECFIPFDSQNAFIRQRGINSEKAHKKWRDSKLAEVRKEIAVANRKFHTFVLSCEHFSSRLTTGTAVDQLARFLHRQFSDISVICYLRRQDRMAVSRINENLKAGFTIDDLPTISSQAVLPKIYNYVDLLDRWAKSFGKEKLCVRVFERDKLVNGNVVEDFASTACLGTLELSLLRAENVSLDATAQLALKMFNVGVGEESRLQFASLRRTLTEYLATASTGKPRRPCRANTRAFYAHFKAGNDSVAQRWLGQATLFEEDFDDYEESPTEPNIESASALLINFFLSRYRQK